VIAIASSLSACTTAAGLKSAWMARQPPVAVHAKVMTTAPTAWNIGAASSQRSPGTGWNAATFCITCALTARWVRTTPLGRPVVPLVYI
jgi:hypothetical protein